MAGVPVHNDFVASSIEVANDPPANNTRGKTPANAGSAKTPAARGSLRSRGRGDRSKTLGATRDATPDEDDDELEDQFRDASQKRARADTFGEETRSLRARAERLEAANALVRAEREALILRTADWHPEQGTFSARVISVSSRYLAPHLRSPPAHSKSRDLGRE